MMIRRMWSCWTKSRGGHKADKRTGAPSLCRQAERVKASQRKDEKVAWRPHKNIPVSEGGSTGKLKRDSLLEL